MIDLFKQVLFCLVIGIIAIALGWPPVAESREFQLIELKEATIGYKSFFPGSHSPLLNESGLTDKQLGKEVNLYFNMDIAKYVYWNNRVHGTSDEAIVDGKANGKGQFRMVGWNFQLGIRPIKYISIEYEHHSQHMLDWDRHNRFPVEDSIGIKLFIFKAAEPSDTIF